MGDPLLSVIFVGGGVTDELGYWAKRAIEGGAYCITDEGIFFDVERDQTSNIRISEVWGPAAEISHEARIRYARTPHRYSGNLTRIDFFLVLIKYLPKVELGRFRYLGSLVCRLMCDVC